jgi:hypothetical protein
MLIISENRIMYNLIRILFLASFIFVICSQTLIAQNENLGYAPYAMMSNSWPCEDQIKSDQNLSELKLAVLWNTFGKNTECLNKYLKDKRLKSLEVHLINEVCQRNNQCGPYEFLYKMSISEYDQKLKSKDADLLKKLTVYFEEVSKFLKERMDPSVQCYINPGLESNVSTEAATVLLTQAKTAFPFCKIVWNPNGQNPAASPIVGTVFEVHGVKIALTPPCISDLDGVDISYPTRPAILPQYIPSNSLPKIAKKYSQCDLALLWIAEYNGLTKGPFIDPRKRESNFFPTLKTFMLVSNSLKSLR